MGWRFRRSIKIFPGFRLNFGKSGFTSTTIGGKYFKTNVSGRGVRHTISAPGTGLSYSTPTYKHSTGTSPAPLYWYCQNCYTGNRPDSSFCSNCGLQYVPPKKLGTNDSRNLMILLGGVLGFVVFVLIAAAIGTALSSPSSSPAVSSPAALISTPKPLLSPSGTPAGPNGNPSNYTKVTASYANLRKTPTTTSSMVEILAAGTALEIISHKGDWYLVRHDKQKGWIHRNEIDHATNSAPPKLAQSQAYARPNIGPPVESYELPDYSYSTPSYSGRQRRSHDRTVKPPTNTYEPPSYSYPPPDYSSPSSSYSSPRPPDSAPKSVSVHGYTRKDGTYVAPYTRRAPRR